MSDSYVIIGDGIAGASAAETLREEAPDAEITVITDEGESLYNRILIKEYAKGKLPEAPISIHDDDWYDDHDVDLRLDTVVVDVDVENDAVHTHDGETFEYDSLLLASGGPPSSSPSRTPMRRGSTTSGRSKTPDRSKTAPRTRTERSSSVPGYSVSTLQPSAAHKMSRPST